LFRSRHYIVCHPTIVNISYNTFHFSLLFLVILTYCLNVVSSCLYIIPLFYKNQVKFNQFQKNPLWFLSPKRIFLFLSIFHYFSLLFSLFFVNLRTITRHPRSAIRFGSTIKPLNISAISHTRSTFNVDPMITQITTITA
jgi:hypothetical protein